MRPHVVAVALEAVEGASGVLGDEEVAEDRPVCHRSYSAVSHTKRTPDSKLPKTPKRMARSPTESRRPGILMAS